MHPAVHSESGGYALGRGRSASLSEHAPLSPQSSVTSSGSGGSDSHHDEGPQPVRDSFLEEGTGMRGQSCLVVVWCVVNGFRFSLYRGIKVLDRDRWR